jgi:hypothetical protein
MASELVVLETMEQSCFSCIIKTEEQDLGRFVGKPCEQSGYVMRSKVCVRSGRRASAWFGKREDTRKW